MHTIVYLVICPSLTAHNDGGITCSLGDDGVPSYEDTCSFTCNTGYELTGSDTRTCQSNGSWNGTEGMCTRGMNHVRLFFQLNLHSKKGASSTNSAFLLFIIF